MFPHHLVLLYASGFDLLIGFLLVRYFWVMHSKKRKFSLPFSWVLILGLVNLSGLFCGANIEEAVVGLGGVTLCLLIIPMISQAQNAENRPQ